MRRQTDVGTAELAAEAPAWAGVQRCDVIWPHSRVALKRVVDVVGAAVGLLLSVPLWLLTALAIKLDSGGRVLFRQVRLGRGGRPFTCLKFRTMKPHAEWVLERYLSERPELRG